MNNTALIQLLERTVSRSKGTRIQRLKNAPKNLLYSKILELFARWFDKSTIVKTKTFWDENMLVVIPEIVSLHIYRYGFFEKCLTRIVLEYLKPGMTFLDIGAHFGYFSLLCSTIVGNDGQVHSFEPTPSSYEMLQSNTSGKRNIYINNIAVFSNRKKLLFKDYGVRFSAFNSACEARLKKATLRGLKVKTHEIETISLDEYIEDRGIEPDFIKIDAENAEYEILQGMEKILNKIRPSISIEVGDMDIKDVVCSKDLILYLIDRGYQPYEFIDGKVVTHELKDRYEYDNILFLPK